MTAGAAERGAVVMLRRDGAPPLKLRAAPVRRHVARRGPAEAEVVLWARGAVGWAVSMTLSWPGPGGPRRRAEAKSVDDLDAAIDFLDTLAGRGLATPCATRRAAAPDMAADRLTARLVAAQAAQALAAAVGEAMAAWTAESAEALTAPRAPAAAPPT